MTKTASPSSVAQRAVTVLSQAAELFVGWPRSACLCPGVNWDAVFDARAGFVTTRDWRLAQSLCAKGVPAILLIEDSTIPWLPASERWLVAPLPSVTA